MWLDADFSGGKSRNSKGKTLKTAVREAEAMLAAVPEGQVGVFDAYGVGEFRGYVIKTPETGVFFEAAQSH